jgi:hypothetical protein
MNKDTKKKRKTIKNKTRKIQKGGIIEKYENMDDYMFDDENSFYNDIFINDSAKMNEFRVMWESFFSLENLENKEKKYKKCENTLRILNSIDYQFDENYNHYIDLLNFAENTKNNFFEEAEKNGEIEKFKEINLVEETGSPPLDDLGSMTFDSYMNLIDGPIRNPYHKILSCLKSSSLELNREKTNTEKSVGEIRIETETFYDIFGFDKKKFNPKKLCKNNMPVILYIYKFLIFDLTPSVYELFCRDFLEDAVENKYLKKNLKSIIHYCIKINSPVKLIQFMELYSTKRYDNRNAIMYCYFSQRGGIEKYREFNYTPIIENADVFISTTKKYEENNEWDLDFELGYNQELLKNDMKFYKDSESKLEEDVLLDTDLYKSSVLNVKHNNYERMRTRIKEYKTNSIIRKNRLLIIDNNRIIYDTMDVYIECSKMTEQCIGTTKIVLISYIDYFINLNIKSDGTFVDDVINNLLSELRTQIETSPPDKNLDVEDEIIKALNLDRDIDLNENVLHILQKFYLLELPLVVKNYLLSCLSCKFGDFYGIFYPLFLLASSDNEIFRVQNRNISYFFDDYNYNTIKEFIEQTLLSYDISEEDIKLYIDIVTPIKEFKYICSNYMLNRTKNVVVTIQLFDILLAHMFQLDDILLGTFVNVSISKNINDLVNVEHLSKCLIAWNPLLETEKERIQNSMEIDDLLSRTLVGEFPYSSKFFYDCVFKTIQESFTTDSVKQYETIKKNNAEIYDKTIPAKLDKEYLLKVDRLKSASLSI